MKNNKIAYSILFLSIFFASCNKQNIAQAEEKNQAIEKNAEIPTVKKSNNNSFVLDTDASQKVSYKSFMTYMKPVFTSEYPDEKNTSNKNQAKSQTASTEKSEAAIPGLRKLNEYLTKYTSKREQIKINSEISDDDIFEDPKIAFKISDWGPQGKIASENEYPSFYVIFSQPVHVLSALENPTSTSDIMSISPEIKGVFRWYGTRHLAFEAEEAADPATVYTIKINPQTKTIGGTTLTGETTFKTKAEQVSITRLWGGYVKQGDSAYSNTSGALPPYENRFYIKLNYMITKEMLSDLLTVKMGNQVVTYSSESLYKPELSIYGYPMAEVKCDETKQKTDSYIITITDEVIHNATITAIIKGGKKDFTYKTLQPFKIQQVSEYTDYTEGTKTNPLRITFTQVPDKETIKDNISFDFDYKLSEENFTIDGTTLTIFNLPISFNESHKISFTNDIKDIYGQTIKHSARSTYNFTVRDALSYIKFLDYGSKMLEAQFPHKMVFEHQNLEANSYYKVSATENPFDLQSEFNQETDSLPEGSIQIPQGEKNIRHFQEIDFEPFLKNGYGFVKFDCISNNRYFDYWSDSWETNTNLNTITVQVTDLGITARMGLNKSVFMVRSLSTGKPVANAQVNILLYSDDGTPLLQNVLASGTTDENGLCVIYLNENQVKRFEVYTEKNRRDYFRVYVTNGDDKAVFSPDSHNNWSFNVRTGNRADVRIPKQRTFIFVDRGLYKPGETVTFRGIDRDQLLGTIKVHQTPYTISIKGSWWNAPSIADPIIGKTSESGGFYGSFKLPDDLEPGSYCIKYERTDDSPKKETYECYFTVAAFERLKIEASVSVPDISFYGGDKLSAELSADYLAGGSLNGAQYSASWYKQGTNFHAETPEAKDYQFGPYDKYSWRTYYSDDKGILSNSGTAQLMCSSEKITDGLTYQYRVEADVTDVSNQSITAVSSVTVHPAYFYAGVKKASNVSGFAKKGQKLEFPYVLVDTKGNFIPKEELSQKVKSLNYVLKRDVWTMVHEQSFSNSVYTRYTKSQVEESTGTVEIASSGNLILTPENAGWYVLEINGVDNKDNPVITSIGFYVTGSGMGWNGNNNSEELTLTPDQNLYNPGDTAQILLESPLQKGDYLITVEREGIFTEEIKHFDEPANVIEVPIASNYVPVVYVAVSSYSDRVGKPVHQYGETDLDKPKGYYGITALNINPYVRAFSVDVECDKQIYRPGEEATITLTATKGGKPLENTELTVMAVDRGILDLIDYHVPNPIEYFYNKNNFPLYVKGGDSRSLLMDPVTYSLKNLVGGDAATASDEEKEDERKDFRPTALFEPVLITDKDGKASVTFKLPDTLTTYRITAFGVKDDLFALQEDEAKVQNPINIQQVQPRKLRERDTAECGVLITNLDSKGQKITVEVEAKTPTKDTTEDKLAGRKTIPGKAFVDGTTKHTVYVAPGDSTVVYFDIGAEKAGTVELVYSITSDILNEKLVSPIKIEKTFVYETVTMIGSTRNDSNALSMEKIVIPDFAKEGRGDLSFTLDATRLGMLGTSVNYLFDYPYGCLEQQSARVLPLVAFGEYIDIFGLDSQISDIKKCVTAYFKDWSKFQLQTGGFPYWPGNANSSFYVSLRIAHIYALALQRGYSENDLAIDIDNLINYISTTIENNKNTNDYEKAYACYILKLLDKHNLDSTLSSLYARSDELTLSAAALTSLALSEDMGINSVSRAKEINTKIRAYLQPVERSVTILDTNRNNDFWWWYESPTDQMALILQAFAKVEPEDQMVDRLLFTLLQKQSMGYWQNTTTTSRVLDAIYTYIKMRNLDETDYSAKLSIDGKNIMTETFQDVNAKPKTLKLPFESEIISAIERNKAIPLTFEKDGPGQLYYTVEMKYAIPDEMQNARDEGLKIYYQISDYETDEIINPQNEEDSCIKLKSGKLYKATIRIESHRDRTYVALRSPIPSGAEILDSTFVTTSSKGETSSSSDSWGHWLSNKSIYDNEIQFFWDNFRTGSATVTFTFRAARRGIYPTPPVQAECMYEPEIFGRSDGYLVEIE